MPTLWIDSRRVDVPPAASLLDAARRLGIAIPTLCHLQGTVSRQGGCLVCVVEDLDSGRLLPACTARATEAARIATDTPRVREARKRNLALLLGDHRADCDAPCRLACPSRLDIPAVLRALAHDARAEAARLVYQSLAIPNLLGAVCPAPCERRCRRRDVDAPLAIRLLHTQTAFESAPALPSTPTGRRIAIIGAGPAGLATAFFLQTRGHACRIIDQQPGAGGALRQQPGFPAEALDRDLDVLHKLGIAFAFNTRIDSAGAWDDLAAGADALVLCCGETGAEPLARCLNIPPPASFLPPFSQRVCRGRAMPVFAAGGAVHPCRLAAMANAQGLAVAEQIDAWLDGRPLTRDAAHQPFRSHAGPLPASALATWVDPGSRSARRLDVAKPLTPEAVRQEAGHCLHCDCLKADSCRLRTVCQAEKLPDSHARHAERAVERIRAGGVVIEPAKCIACGICIQRSQMLRAPLGIAFHGRGYDVRVGPPIGHTWQELPAGLLRDAAENCPTGAIAVEAE